VRSTADFAASDWVRWWSAIEEVTDRWGNPVKIPGKPWRFSRDTFAPAKDASYRGENNADVLRELGYCDAEIAQLHKSGIILSNVHSPAPPAGLTDVPDDLEDKQAASG